MNALGGDQMLNSLVQLVAQGGADVLDAPVAVEVGLHAKDQVKKLHLFMGTFAVASAWRS